MSDLIKDCKLSDSRDCAALARVPIHEKIPTRNAELGKGLVIHRAMPQRARRMIGAWCFFDHFGPLNLKQGDLNVAPHPHIGLQTFTWTLAGEILHRDSLGSNQVIRPGAVNIMTAGRGISHSEESVPDTLLHGVQLWIALPEAMRHCEPAFVHHPEMPVHEQDGVRFTVLAGEAFGLRAPTQVYTPLVGLDLATEQAASTTLSLQPQFEYGVLVLSGSATIDGEPLESDVLLYLGCGRQTLSVQLSANARVFLIGGEPFGEEILLWWNFVGRTREDIAEATADWRAHAARFGEVTDYQGVRLEAPDVPALKTE